MKMENDKKMKANKIENLSSKVKAMKLEERSSKKKAESPRLKTESRIYGIHQPLVDSFVVSLEGVKRPWDGEACLAVAQ